MGRSRGGLTTKIHAVVDALGRPIRLMLTAGQVHDSHGARELLVDLETGAVVVGDRPMMPIGYAPKSKHKAP